MGAPSKAQSQRIAPGVRIGSYLVAEMLGEGGMGTVYKGKHVGLDKPVVIKTLHSQLATRDKSVQRFVREGRAASKIRHPHVVDVTDVGTHEGQPFLVMEYLEGEDLHRRLEAVGRLTTAEIVRVVLPVLDALAYAHDAGVIHRDLKPSNIFLAKGPHGEVPMILDFGIAKLVDTETFDAKTITVAASYLGTPYYSSPEQAKSGRNATPLSDQYSMGAIMYELVTGEHGLPGETPFEVLSAIVARQRAQITLVGSVDPALATIIERAMSYEAADRFPSIRHLGHALLPLAPPDVAQRWASAFHVDVSQGAGAGFAETMASGPAVVEPSGPISLSSPIEPSGPVALNAVAEPSGPIPGPAFTPPGSIPGIPGVPDVGRDSGMPPTRLAAELTPVGVEPRPSFTTAPPPEPSSRLGIKLLIAAIAGFVVAAGVAGGVWYSQTQRAPEPLTVTLRAAPETASFELDGEPIAGHGEVTVRLPEDGLEHRLSVRAEGYAPREDIRFFADSPPERVALAPLEAEAQTGDEAPADPTLEPSEAAADPVAEGDPPPEAPPEPGEATPEPGEAVEPASSGGSRDWWREGSGAAPRGQAAPGPTGGRRRVRTSPLPTPRVAPVVRGTPGPRPSPAPRRGANGAVIVN